MKKIINKRGLTLKEIRNILVELGLKSSLLKMWIMEKLGLWEIVVIVAQNKEINPTSKITNLIMLIEKNRKSKELFIKNFYINLGLLNSYLNEDLNMIRFEIPAYINNLFLTYAREGYQGITLECNKSEKKLKKYLGTHFNFWYNHYLSVRKNKYVLQKELNPEKLKPILQEIG